MISNPSKPYHSYHHHLRSTPSIWALPKKFVTSPRSVKQARFFYLGTPTIQANGMLPIIQRNIYKSGSQYSVLISVASTCKYL